MNKIISLIAQFTFSLLFLRAMLGSYDVKTIYLTVFINFILLYLILALRFSGRLLLILLWGAIVVVHNKESLALVDLALFTYVLRHDNLTKYVKLGFLLYVVAFIAILSMLSMDVIHNQEILFVHKGKVIANSMGMGSSNIHGGNPNITGLFFFSSFVFTYLRFEGQKYAKDIVLIVVIAVLSYLAFDYTQARAAFYSSLLMCSFAMFMPLIRKFTFINKVGLSLVPIVVAITSLYISLHQNSFYELDQLASDRVSNPAFIIAKMQPLDWLIGTNIPEDMAMDSSYMTILFEGGVPAFLFIFGMLVVRIWRNYETIIKWEPMIVAVLAYGAMENIFSSFNCLSVVFFTFIFYPKSFNQIIKYRHNGRKKTNNLRSDIVHEPA